MTTRSHERFPIAIGFGILVCMAHVAALSPIVISAWRYLSSPAVQAPWEPEFFDAVALQGEMVHSLARLPAEDLMMLRFVDLKTGKSRDLEPTSVFFTSLLSDGKTIWGFGDDTRIYETDGHDVAIYQTEHSLSLKPTVQTQLFLYEGHPAAIDLDNDGKFRLKVLIDRDWHERGQLALPGRRRAWADDPQTGLEVMIPRTSLEPLEQDNKPPPVRVIRMGNEYHLLQIESESQSRRNLTEYVVSHRVGFDFVVAPDDETPASALWPENDVAETTGWNRLASKLKWWLVPIVAHDDALLLLDADHVWKYTPSKNPTKPETFESLLDCEETGFKRSGMVSVPESGDVYVFTGSRLGECHAYRLRGDRFEKLPYQLDGILSPIRRRLGVYLRQIIAVLWAGTLIAIIAAALLCRWLGLSTYSFGQDTLRLAPLVRRSIARAIDLVLVLAPLANQAYWSISHADSQSFIEVLNTASLGLDSNMLQAFVPSLGWAIGTWLAIIVATGIWGISPGKWICRVRVVRTTLRPCGLTRALLRELLLWFDAPLLLTALPCVISWITTDNRQRIGDVSADTIVIESRSGVAKSLS